MKTINFITHDGIFHADEVFAYALLMVYVSDSINLIRTRDKETIEHYQDYDDAYVVDVGGIYDKEKLCFDHHQDQGLVASNLLVFGHLFNTGVISHDLYFEMLPFMDGISSVDTGRSFNEWSDFDPEHKFRNVNQIIAGFNRDPRDKVGQMEQFYQAVSVAKDIFDNEIHAAERRIAAEKTWEDRIVLHEYVALFEEFCPIWKQKNSCLYAIMPNPQGWAVSTINSEVFPLPVIPNDAEDLVFQHKGQFITVFKTKEAAVKFAMSIVENV